MKKKALIIEDNPEVTRVLERTLLELGLECDRAADGESGLQKALHSEYALILIDINLPKVDGFRVCRSVRADKPLVPIIMVTSRGAERDRVNGLMIGADDYVVKPFSSRELAARIQGLLRRANAPAPSISNGEVIAVADLRIDPKEKMATFKGALIDLTNPVF